MVNLEFTAGTADAGSAITISAKNGSWPEAILPFTIMCSLINVSARHTVHIKTSKEAIWFSPGNLSEFSPGCMLLGMLLSTGLTSLSSLLYVTQIFSFAPALVIPSIGIILVTVGFSIFSALTRIRITRRQMEYNAGESGMSYSIISGIQKMRLDG